MSLERHKVHDLEVRQPYPGCDNDDDDKDDGDEDEEEKPRYLGKMLMFTAIISVLDVMLLESLLVVRWIFLYARFFGGFYTGHLNRYIALGNCISNNSLPIKIEFHLNRVGDWSLWSFHFTLK